jgi:hypothetical protein
MSQSQLLKQVIGRLEAAGIEYMLTGSVVSSLQGEPRATHDIDIVIAVRSSPEEAARALRAAFPDPEYFLDEAAAKTAIGERRMVNLIDLRESDKIDLWLLTDDEFDRNRFSRRRTERFEDIALVVSSPEDTILMKLRWAQLAGGSEKQFVDALRVYEVQRGVLDQSYLDHWAEKLGVAPLLARLRAQAQPLD